MLKGREVHEGVERVNKDYLRKRIGCVKRESSVELSSEKYCLKGIVDEVLTLSDGTMAPLDYKYIEFSDNDFEKVKKTVGEVLHIIQEGYFPSRAGSRLRCIDCCYKNICV